jgi:G3E family GTPase
VRGDLVDTLRELMVKRAKGEVRAFDRLVIETTGLADPAPVIQALMTFPVARRFRLKQIVTTVDAVNGERTLDRQPESLKQAAVADDIVVTKTDLPGEALEQLKARLRKLNPGARLHYSSIDNITSPNDLAAADIYDPATKSEDVARWLNFEAHGHAHADHHGHEHGHNHTHEHAHRHDVNRHDAQIGSFCLEYDEPLHWEHVSTWLDALIMAHGDDVLRVKGIMSVIGRNRPIVVQAVQRLFHPPFELAEWPAGERKSRIVFITRGLSRDYVVSVLDTIRQRAIPVAAAS